MEAEEAAPLFQRIITKTKFEDNVDEITFTAPVCLTGIAVGAMPGAIPDGGHAFLNIFARDSRACGSARFACLYEGLQQPAAGVTAVHIQPFVTDHVVLRGCYQTAPITLLGVPLAEAASQYVPRPETPLIDIDQALPRFQDIVESLAEENGKEERKDENADTPTAATNKISFLQDAWPALEPLVKFWRKVGSSYRKISTSVVPAAAFKTAFQAADALCEKIAKFDDGSVLTISNDVHDTGGKNASINDSELVDMAMGWCGLLAEIPVPLATCPQTFECLTAGIAAMVLISTRPSAATALLARHGQLLLANALKSPLAPGSQLRHATAACLLLALTNGGAGCEALLGWWSPSFVQWAAPPPVKKPVVEGDRKKEYPHEERVREKVKSDAGKGEERKKTGDQDRPFTTATTTTAATADIKKKYAASKEEDKQEEKQKKKPTETAAEKEKEGGSTQQPQRRRRGGAAIPSIIPQVDGANDEKRRNKNNNNKRQKRDASNNNDHHQQQRGNRNGNSDRGGRSNNKRQNRGDVDDRWDGGGPAVVDIDDERWQPEYIFEEKEEVKEHNDREGGRRRGRDEEKRGSDRHRRHSGSSDRGRSRDRSRRDDKDRGRDEPRRRSRDRHQKERKDTRPSRDHSPPVVVSPIEKKGRKEEDDRRRHRSKERNVRDEIISKDVEKKQERGRERGRRDEAPEKKVDLRQHQQQRQPPPSRAPPPGPIQPAPAGIGAGNLPPPTAAAGKKGKQEQEDIAILHKFTYFWDDRLRHYVGVYSSLATILMQIQPRTLTTLGTRLMRILRFYEHVTMFSNLAEELVSQYMPSKRSSLPSQEAVAQAVKCGAALANVAEYLAIGKFTPSGENWNTLNLKNSGRKIDPLLLELMTSRRVLSLLPALILVPATHKARSEEDGGDAAITAAASSAAMSNQLALGVRPFLSALTSNVSGFKALAAAPGVVSELLRVLRLSAALDTSLSSAVAPLGHLVVALAAVEDLSSCSLTCPKFSSAVATIGQHLSSGPSQRIPAVHAVCLSANKALPKLVEAVLQRCDVLLEAGGMAPLKSEAERRENNKAFKKKEDEDDEEEFDDGDAFGRVLDSLPSLEICTDILLAVLKECTSLNIASSLAPTAAAMLPTLSVAAQAVCGCPAPGAATVFTAVETICGGLEALSTLYTSVQNKKKKDNENDDSANVVQNILAALSSDLPPLAPVDFENFLSSSTSSAAASLDINEESNGGGSSMYVGWADIREFWDNPRKKYRSEVNLKLLTMLLWQPTTNCGDLLGGRNAAAEMQYNDGQRIVLRALLTAGEAAFASHADRQWVSRTGAAIDPATAASNKLAAFEFLSSAAATASAFFQHMRDVVPVKSTACAAALLEAHAIVSSEEDCLLALMGQGSAATCGAAALTARHHLTAALRCWLECSSSSSADTPWNPSLLPLILFGSKGAKWCRQHAVPALPPRQLFTAACVLGDLSPTEWPPAGTRRVSNPPPSFRAYRFAFAKAIEQHKGPFSSLISACVEAEPTLLRAAAARMLARAAGFGGGMGAFVIGPIVAGLEVGASSQTPAHDVRKVLELLVPLVYRPALKAALLDTTAPATLANILRVMVTGIPHGAATTGAAPVTIDPSDASAICTMALECLVVLCNPEHMLDPQVSPEVAAIEDVPHSDQGAVIASTLLEILTALGVNIPLAHRVLRLLTLNVSGRVALRLGAAAVHAKATGAINPGSNPTMSDVGAAAQWVAHRFWGLSQQAQHAESASSSSTNTTAEAYADVSSIMKEICVTSAADGNVASPPQAPKVSERFAAATKAAIAAGSAGGVDVSATEHRWEKGIPDPITATTPASNIAIEGSSGSTTVSDLAVASGVFDPVTRMFWKNYRARAVQQTPASAGLALRKYTRRTCLPDEHFTVADTLHLPLTRPLRPLKEDMEAGQEADDGGGEGDAVVSAKEDRVPQTIGNGEQQGKGEKAQVAVPPAEVAEVKNEEMPSIAVAPIIPPAAAVPVIAPSSVPAADFDLYADLGGDLGIGGGGGGGGMAAAPVAASAVEKVLPKVEPAAHATVAEQKTEEEVKEEKEKETVSVVISPEHATEAGVSPKTASDDPATLLNDPAAIAVLLQDPVKMQELLQRNPALLVALKSKLGGGGGASN